MQEFYLSYEHPIIVKEGKMEGIWRNAWDLYRAFFFARTDIIQSIRNGNYDTQLDEAFRGEGPWARFLFQESHCFRIMELTMKYKFEDPTLRKLLLSCPDEIIFEDPHYPGLGEILTSVRRFILDSQN